MFREESSRRPIVAVVVAGRRDQFHQLHQQLNNLEAIGAPSYGIDKHCRGKRGRKKRNAIVNIFNMITQTTKVS